MGGPPVGGRDFVITARMEALPERVHAWRRVHEFALPERGLVELQPVRSQCIRPF